MEIQTTGEGIGFAGLAIACAIAFAVMVDCGNKHDQRDHEIEMVKLNAAAEIIKKAPAATPTPTPTATPDLLPKA